MERKHIQRVLDYIEAHLPEALDNRTLARVAGYSEFHFLRLFRKHVRLTPADYIRKRRLSEIVIRMTADPRPMADIAFAFGFNSKENFTRAFVKEHRILPSAYRQTSCSLHLFAPMRFDQAVTVPEVSLQYLAPFTLVAYPFHEEGPPDRYWNRYNTQRLSARLTGREGALDFGAMLREEGRSLRYLIGVRAEDALGDTSGTVRLPVPGGLYAMVKTPPATQHDFVAVIRRTWDYVCEQWMPQSGFVRGHGVELECYVESSRTYSETIYIPITKEDPHG